MYNDIFSSLPQEFDIKSASFEPFFDQLLVSSRKYLYMLIHNDFNGDDPDDYDPTGKAIEGYAYIFTQL